MPIDPQTFVALLIVVGAVSLLARRLKAWLSGRQSGCGGCSTCPSSKNSAPGLVSLTDFSVSGPAAASPLASEGLTNRRLADSATSTPA